MDAPEGIVVAPADPAWPSVFAVLAGRLRAALGTVARRIDHIGSTSIAGLDAKPIIDVQISVVSFVPLAAYRTPIESAGYLFRPDNPERTKRYFREGPGEPRTHIHVRRAGSFSEQFAILFREYLRVHPERAAAYGALKHELATRYAAPEDRPRYVDAKEPFIWDTVRLADGWAQATGWEPPPSDA